MSGSKAEGSVRRSRCSFLTFSKQTPSISSPVQRWGGERSASSSEIFAPHTPSYGETSVGRASPVLSSTANRLGFWANLANSIRHITAPLTLSHLLWSKPATCLPRSLASFGVGAARISAAEVLSSKTSALEYIRACSAVANFTPPKKRISEGNQLANMRNGPSVSFQKNAKCCPCTNVSAATTELTSVGKTQGGELGEGTAGWGGTVSGPGPLTAGEKGPYPFHLSHLACRHLSSYAQGLLQAKVDQCHRPLALLQLRRPWERRGEE